MIKFINEKVENEPLKDRYARHDRIMNTVIWGNEHGFMGEMEKYPNNFTSTKEQEILSDQDLEHVRIQ